MNRPTIALACSLYDRILPLYHGEVEVAGFDVQFQAAKSLADVRNIFDNVATKGAYDVAEMSICEYLVSAAGGTSQHIGLPIFPSRAFRSNSVFVRTDTIESPADLAGRRIGVPVYGMTAAVFARGFLVDEYGVDFAGCDWLQGAMNQSGLHGRPQLPDLHRPLRIEQNTSERSLSQLLEHGEIDATLGALVPEAFGRAPLVKRLFPDYRAVELDYLKRTQVFPIMHLIVVRKDTAAKHPQLVQSLYDAFCKSKAIALERMRETATLQYMLPWLSSHVEELDELFDGDAWRYGTKRNAPTLDALTRYLYEQGFTGDRVDWRAHLAKVDELMA